jgi:hypothetical protein
MAALWCVGAQSQEGEISPPLPTQPFEHRVLPPFAENLRVDEKLKLRQEKFKQTIDDFIENKDTTPLSQLTTPPPFPTPHVLAQFANKTYKDYKKREGRSV